MSGVGEPSPARSKSDKDISKFVNETYYWQINRLIGN